MIGPVVEHFAAGLRYPMLYKIIGALLLGSLLSRYAGFTAGNNAAG